MKDTQLLTQAVVDMEEDKALALTRQLLESKTDPVAIFNAYQDAMAEVGKRFEKGIYFIPELVMSGDMMKTAMEIIKPYLNESDTKDTGKKIGKILIATVEGDIHDIGKNIVSFLLDANGFEVLDIGIDVQPEIFVERIREFEPEVVGLSGLLTLAYDTMKETVAAIEEAGLRGQVKIMIGGGQMNDKIREYAGADAYGKDAMAAVVLAKQWIGIE